MEDLLDLDLQEIIIRCKTNPTICQDDAFWKKKFIHDYGKIPTDLPWRFLYEIYYTNQKPKVKETPKILDQLVLSKIQEYLPLDERAAPISKDWVSTYHESKEYDIIKSVKNPDQGLAKAVQANKMDLIQYFLQKKANLNVGLREAAKTSNRKLIDYFLEKGAKSSKEGFLGAVEAGDKELIEFFLNKVRSYARVHLLNDGLLIAAKLGNLEIVKYLAEKGVKYFDDTLMDAAEGQNMEVIEYLIDKGAHDWSDGVKGAAKVGNVELINYFINKFNQEYLELYPEDEEKDEEDEEDEEDFDDLEGEEDVEDDEEEERQNKEIAIWTKLLEGAIEGLSNCKSETNIKCVNGTLTYLIKYAIQKGADIYQGLMTAVRLNNLELAEYLTKQGINRIKLNKVLFYAIDRNNLDMIKILVAAGANDFKKAKQKAEDFEREELVKYFDSKIKEYDDYRRRPIIEEIKIR